MPDSTQPPRQVLVCQNRTCRKQGAAKVLTVFQAEIGSSEVFSETPVEIIESGCLGQCGNGPMVLVEPDGVWYCRVRPDEVPSVVVRHLQQGSPVRGMLYPKFHG
ncbi:MAG: (2Fe-2S) ferredoxin domain-containing protein [Cyanobacteria bacterium P01_A01_bin.135]